VCPMAGFAVRPENPSAPPHLRPTHRLESGAGERLDLLASTKPEKVCRIASVSMANSEPLCCA
jgi:hypothetical protein